MPWNENRDGPNVVGSHGSVDAVIAVVSLAILPVIYSVQAVKLKANVGAHAARGLNAIFLRYNSRVFSQQ
jgi:hypothetical protein